VIDLAFYRREQTNTGLASVKRSGGMDI